MTQPLYPTRHRRSRSRQAVALASPLLFVIGALAGLFYTNPLFTTSALAPLLRPIEHNAHLRPSSTSPDLLSVAFTEDGQLGLAVGANGTILKSTNRGATWTSRQSGTDVSLRSVDLAENGQTAWAVGDAGTILHSLDAGDSWLLRASNTGAVLFSIAFGTSGQTGWAVGNDGTALRSTDGGVLWTPVATPTSEELWSVVPVGSAPASFWLVGTNGTILRSNAGGTAWTSPTPPQGSAHLYSVHFTPTGQFGWAVGAPGAFRRFANSTWADRANIAPNFLWSVASGADGQDVVAVGTAGTIVRSGRHWCFLGARSG